MLLLLQHQLSNLLGNRLLRVLLPQVLMLPLLLQSKPYLQAPFFLMITPTAEWTKMRSNTTTSR